MALTGLHVQFTYATDDGDRIYGVIRSSTINHGGRTNGFTVPNPNAQAELITEALEEAGVDPRHLSYVEAHGTGTALGDPIEAGAIGSVTGSTSAISSGGTPSISALAALE